MSQLLDIPNFIKDIVENLSERVVFTNPVLVDGVYLVDTTDTSYLKEKAYITVNGEPAKVVDVIKNVSFSFSFIDVVPIALEYADIKPYNFYYGTQRMTKAVLDSEKDNTKRFPLVWFYSIYDETVNRNSEELEGQTASMRLFILDQSNFKDWVSLEHHNKVIEPLQVYIEELLNKIDDSSVVMENGITSVNLRKHANFGQYQEEGHIAKIFSDDLSGVEMSLNVSIKKQNNCN